MAFGLVGQDPGEVGSPTSRPVTEVVPPKNSLRTGMRRTSAAAEAVDEGAQDPGAVLAGEDADGRAAAGASP